MPEFKFTKSGLMNLWQAVLSHSVEVPKVDNVQLPAVLNEGLTEESQGDFIKDDAVVPMHLEHRDCFTEWNRYAGKRKLALLALDRPLSWPVSSSATDVQKVFSARLMVPDDRPRHLEFQLQADHTMLIGDWPSHWKCFTLIGGLQDEFIDPEFAIPGSPERDISADDQAHGHQMMSHDEVRLRSLRSNVASDGRSEVTLLACRAKLSSGILVEVLGSGPTTTLFVTAEMNQKGVEEDFICDLQYRHQDLAGPQVISFPIRLKPNPTNPKEGRELHVDFPWPDKAATNRGELRVRRAVRWSDVAGLPPAETADHMAARTFAAFPLEQDSNGIRFAVHSDDQRRALSDPSTVWCIEFAHT